MVVVQQVTEAVIPLHLDTQLMVAVVVLLVLQVMLLSQVVQAAVVEPDLLPQVEVQEQVLVVETTQVFLEVQVEALVD